MCHVAGLESSNQWVVVLGRPSSMELLRVKLLMNR